MTQTNKLSFEKDSIFAEGYGTIAKKVMRDKRLSPEAKAIYSYICSFAGAGKSAFPGAELMMEELQMSEKRFYKHRKMLIDYRYITIIKNRNENRRDNNTYFISQHGSFERVQNESIQNESVQNEGANNNSLNNNSLNNNSTKKIYTPQFLEWYEIYPNKFNKEQTCKSFNKLIKEETFENLMKATRNYMAYLKQKNITDKQYIFKSTNFVGQKKAYQGYLEIEQEQKNDEDWRI